MSKTELEDLIQIQKDSEYLNKSYDTFKQKYANQYIAIKNRTVIANHKDINILLRMIRAKKLDPAMTLIDFVSPKDMLLIL